MHFRAVTNALFDFRDRCPPGDFMDASIIHTLFTGAYGAFVNTDGFTVGEAAEMLGAITIVSRLTSMSPIQILTEFVSGRLLVF